MKQNKETLKTYFETGDKPTEQQYGDLIDSYLDSQQPEGEPNRRFVINEDGSVTVTSELGVLQNVEFIDTEDEDKKSDSLKFTFTSGNEIIVNVNELFDIDAFKTANIGESNQQIINFETIGGQLVPLNLSSWFGEKFGNDNIPVVGGRNLLIRKDMIENFILQTDGNVIPNNAYDYQDFSLIESETEYVITIDHYEQTSNCGYIKIAFYDNSQNQISQVYYAGYSWSEKKFITPANTKYFRLSGVGIKTAKIQLEKGIIATQWNLAPEDIIEEAKKVSYEEVDNSGVVAGFKPLNITKDNTYLSGGIDYRVDFVSVDRAFIYGNGNLIEGSGITLLGNTNVTSNGLWLIKESSNVYRGV